MNRAERRKINKHDLEVARKETEEELSAVLLCVWLNVLHDEGVPYERLTDLVVKATDEYDRISNFETYKKETLDRVGISIERTRL